MPEPDSPFPDSPSTVSVVVPTRDRPGPLARCLDALAAQSVSGESVPDLEVVVVDDGSRDAGAVAAVVEVHPFARLVRAGGDGPAVARNRGAEAATGDIVCFTDDDCRPVPGWVAALVRAVAAGRGAVAGPTVVGADQGRCSSAAQVVTNHLVTESLSGSGETVGFAPTCNLAVRADVARSFPFDEGFPLAAGEDREWCARVTAAGHPIGFVPDAVVHHHPDLDLRRFWRQQARYGRGAAHLRARVPDEGLAEPAFYARLLRAGVREGPVVGALVVLAQAATAAGVLRARIAPA